MNQLQKSLLILLLIQGFALVGMNLNSSISTTSTEQPLINVATEQIIRFTVESSDAQSTGKGTLEIERKGDKWVIPVADDFALDTAKVEAVLKKLIRMSADTPVARSVANHNTLNVGERTYTKTVSLGTADQTIELVMGDAKGRSMYVRKKSEAEVYLAKGITTFDVGDDITNYTDPEYFSVTDIKDVVIERPNSKSQPRTHLYQNERGEWLVDGLDDERIDQSRVRAVLAAVRSARMVRPVGKSFRPEFGLGNPQARVSVTGKPNSIEFVVGRTLDDFVYLKASDKEDVILVRKYTVDAILNLNAKNLIDTTKTTTPTSNSGGAPSTPSFSPIRP
jgi:hypothetical protein